MDTEFRDELLYTGKWLDLRHKQLPNGKNWEYAKRCNDRGACGIVATTDNGEIILIRQYRYAIGKHVIEFPAGLIDEDESVTTTALRELQEETGYLGKVLYEGPGIYSSPGLTDECITMIHVKVTGKTNTAHESEEIIEVLNWPLNTLWERLKEHTASGDAVDAKLWSFAFGQQFTQ
ncbi:MAG: NUDIX hydrolase [Opitutales bacterium]|nr:NUDIX hydrolase [Opitutales bacterium]